LPQFHIGGVIDESRTKISLWKRIFELMLRMIWMILCLFPLLLLDTLGRLLDNHKINVLQLERKMLTGKMSKQCRLGLTQYYGDGHNGGILRRLWTLFSPYSHHSHHREAPD
jgi:hypothetical protein